ncbi:hypothetical protein J6590_006577 [Homalodisca vitripennis]|nr:hypothetical protein J6590_006577 [Homalodisca vitripennis]
MILSIFVCACILALRNELLGEHFETKPDKKFSVSEANYKEQYIHRGCSIKSDEGVPPTCVTLSDSGEWFQGKIHCEEAV